MINAAHHTNKIGQADIAKLRSAEQQLRACWSSMRESMLFMDEQGVVQFANNAAYQLFDYPADELQGAYLQQLIAAPFSEHLCQTIHHLAKANIDRRDQLPKEVSIIRKYGAVLPVEFTLTQTTIDNNNHFIAVLRDLTTQNDIKRIRREFVSLINQELRAPLTSIHGSLDLISGGAVGHVNGQIKQLVGVASKNTKRMIRLINDILDMEKMQTGRLAFNYSSQSVLPLVEQAVEAISSYAAEKNVRVIVQEFLNRSEFIKVDVDRMLQVFSYLLSNAVKYSPKGNEVRVQIRKEQGAVKISIRDFGPGLPREFQMRFFRSDDHADMRSSHMEGVGLSLSMAKMLTEKMGGEIGYDGDEHPGALFYIKLSEWQTVSETETRQA